MKIKAVSLLLMILALAYCGKNSGSAGGNPGVACSGVTVRPVATPAWTSGFSDWLVNNGYAHIAANQGWGGNDGSCTLSADKDPIVFIHGNSTSSDPSTSFNTLKNYLLSNGYQSCDLYAITWIESNSNGSTIHHKADYIKLVRDFIKAVKAYTGKSKVDVISWSMGVTIGRKAIKGGAAYNDSTRTNGCDLGANMKDDIDTFIGVAGVNRGLTMCAGGTSNSCSDNAFKIDSGFLVDLNGGSGGSYHPDPIASFTYSVYLPNDEYICGISPRLYGAYSCDVSGVHTSIIPSGTASISFNVNNSLFDSSWGTNNYCAYELSSPSQKQWKCDHILVFYDNYTDLTPSTTNKGSFYVLLKQVRDNDVSYTSNP